MRVPDPRRKRARSSRVKTFAAMTNALLALRDWLVAERVSVVSMEANLPIAAGCAGKSTCGLVHALLQLAWPVMSNRPRAPTPVQAPRSAWHNRRS